MAITITSVWVIPVSVTIVAFVTTYLSLSSALIHQRENRGVLRGFFLASKSRLGYRPVCPYSTQTCQTFHHQCACTPAPHSTAEVISTARCEPQLYSTLLIC